MGQLAEFVTNHPFLIAGLIAAWAAVMFYEVRLRAQGQTHVSATDAVRLINKGALVVDVRSADAFQGGHIVNARNISLDQIQTGQDVLKKQKAKVLLTVCDNGLGAAKAAGLLRKAGYEHAFSIKGGIGAWRGENLPLVK